MANTIASAGTHAPQSPSPVSPTQPLAWIKRRAKRLAAAYRISRHDAVTNAAIDWSHLHPASAK